ncbi:MAG TPA: phosphopantothenoylcysteine decarboxylase, partial [Actinotalea sp.]|nr:phosphopantothenoylcysteine decarboxylase [Actinotalea sp.]
GGTREPLDPVRFLGNRSTGRQGVALAVAARDRGAEVTLVAANLEVPVPESVHVVPVETTAQLRDAVRSAALDADVVVMAAAVADFRPATRAEGKIKKTGEQPTPIALAVNPDVLAELAADRLRAGQVVVGFAAETGTDDEVLAQGRAKARRKGADLLVLNRVGPGIGFAVPENAVTLLDARGEVVGAASGAKDAVAHAVWDAVLGRLVAHPA